ncbi:Crotonobetainyl-CoA:carnitine CoA-transferase CaiB [Brevibacterium siliguriense]|uniref:Crotonobetainyl-CoA:carnitine CoA-transferase CaiB n=1 Tax=Brevibacterium siliguriense TaxID=1136497 RepID=A0A1H1Y2U3_9MICO|nr:CoA transferase [Brevibacterium siliguriense]SDT15713.1 Crotonobetainyl-CoA:carnitine CoA-transferase CaiB [Brevibacterium siliguriense]
MTDAQPLGGITVVSLAINLPGPLAAARLCALGARVIKVEPPTGDPLNLMFPDYYQELTAGQEIRTIDLKDTEGIEQLRTLMAEADLLLTSMRPRAAAALGLPELVDEHGLVHVEIVGFAGDRADVPGHDLTYQAAHSTLLPGTMPTVPVADVLGGEHAAFQALAGLHELETRRTAAQGAGDQDPHGRHDGGIVRRVVLDEAAAWAAGPARHGMSTPGGPLGGGTPFYRTYSTTDGHVAIACLEPHFAKALASLLGSEHEELERAFAAEPTAHWIDFAAEYDLPIERVALG